MSSSTGSSFLAACVVYFVSGVFWWPLFVAWWLRNLAGRVGWPYGPLGAALVIAAYVALSYGGAPERGGGRCWHWLNRRWPGVCHGYFPVSLCVWDGTASSPVADWAPGHHVHVLPSQFILAMHPHGPFPVSASLLMPQLAALADRSGDDALRRVRFAAASATFVAPIVRDMYLALGCIEAGRATLSAALQRRGLSVAILPGGEDEQLLVCPRASPFEDVVEPRDGLFRLALTSKTPLVPAFAFGEREAYSSSAFLLATRKRWVRDLRVGIPCAWGRHWWFPFVPNQGPIRIVVGEPLVSDASQAVDAHAIAALRMRYRDALTSLFETHKGPNDAHKTLRWLPNDRQKHQRQTDPNAAETQHRPPQTPKKTI